MRHAEYFKNERFGHYDKGACYLELQDNSSVIEI